MIASVLQSETAAAPARGSASVSCSHCGLPVPSGLLERGSAEQYCCAGCRTAYAVIHGCGLDRYYALREGAEGVGPARASGKRFAEFDDPVFERLYVTERPGGLR